MGRRPKAASISLPLHVAQQGHKWTSDAEKNLVLRMKSTAEDLAVAMTQPGRKANPLTAEMKTMAEELELAMEHQEEIHEVFVRASEDATS